MKTQKIMLTLLMALITLSPICAAKTTAEDTLSTVPQEALLALQINNLDQSMGMLDQYLTGIAPISTGMMLKMQLGSMLGDPMLNGIDTSSSFTLFICPTPQNAPTSDMNPPSFEDMVIVIAAPLTDYNQFVEAEANRMAPDADGIAETKDGQTLIMPRVNENIALLAQSHHRTQLLALAENLRQNPLMNQLDKDQKNMALSKPMWLYLNIDKANMMFRPFIDMGFQQMQAEMTKAEQEMPQFEKIMEFYRLYFSVIRAALDQTQYISLAIEPSPAMLSINETFAAKPGTTLADMMIPDKSKSKGFRYASMLNTPQAVNFLMKYNQPQMQKMADKAFDLFGPLMDQQILENVKKLNDEYMKIPMYEIAGSFSFVQAAPMVQLREFIACKDPQKARTLWADMADSIGKMYQSFGLPMNTSYEKAAASYNGIEIDHWKFDFDYSQFTEGMQQMAGEEMSEEEKQQMQEAQDMMMEKMYGPDGLQYQLAFLDEDIIFTIDTDPDAMPTIIDQLQNNTAKPHRDITQAMELLPNAEKADTVMTINYLRLMSQIFSAAKNFMPEVPGNPFMDMFADLDMESKSAIYAAATTYKGKVVADVILPKDHLFEIANAVMQIQAKFAAMQQAQQPKESGQNDQPSPEAVMPEPESYPANQNPFLTSPSGKYILSIPVEEPNWQITIYDPENRSLYLDESGFTGHAQVYWLWDEYNILWLYDAKTDTVRFWEYKNDSWNAQKWGSRSQSSSDRELTPPAGLFPDSPNPIE